MSSPPTRLFRVIDPYDPYDDENDQYEGSWDHTGKFQGRAYVSGDQRRCPIHGAHYSRPAYDEFTPNTHGRYWKLSLPPEGHDVLLPRQMSDQYRLFFPAYSEAGFPLKWHYEPLGSSYRSSVVPEKISYVKGPQPRIRGVVDHLTPPYLVEGPKKPETEKPEYRWKQQQVSHPSSVGATKKLEPEQLRYGLQNVGAFPTASTPTYETPRTSPVEEGRGWRVYHGTDELGDHTIVFMENTAIEIRPQQTVKLAESTLEKWLSQSAHEAAINLGKNNPNFSHIWLAYSDSTPQTHALIGKFALHIDNAVTLTFINESSRCNYED